MAIKDKHKRAGSDKNEGGLTERQVKAIPHLVAATTYDQGCRDAKIARNTLYEWLKDPAFKDELKSQRDRVIEGALEILKGHTARAVEALVGLLATNNEYLKRTVAIDIIDRVLKWRELEEFEKRISQLERKMEGGK